jgi:hypothetical protein
MTQQFEKFPEIFRNTANFVSLGLGFGAMAFVAYDLHRSGEKIHNETEAVIAATLGARKLDDDSYIASYSNDTKHYLSLQINTFERSHPNLKVLTVLDQESHPRLQAAIKGLNNSKIGENEIVFMVISKPE